MFPSVGSFCFGLRMSLLQRIELRIQVICLALLFNKLFLYFVNLRLRGMNLIRHRFRRFNKLQTKSTLLPNYASLHGLKQRFAYFNFLNLTFKFLDSVRVHWTFGVAIKHLLSRVLVKDTLELFAGRHGHIAGFLTVHGCLNIGIGVRYLDVSFHTRGHCHSFRRRAL